MPQTPHFFILAGPNGAGKSTNGHLYVPPGVPVFNGDQVFADLVKKYPGVATDRLHGGVAKALEDARDAALAVKKDFAFESNYSSDLATEITTLFKDSGYQTTLIYFGLDNLKQSATRVSDRKMLGGHNVQPEVIQYNFEEGIRRVKKDFPLFDSIFFVDSRNHNTRIIALVQKKQQLQMNLVENIGWYDMHFKAAIDSLAIKNIKKVREILPDKNKGLGL